jgi:hypothetical protein
LGDTAFPRIRGKVCCVRKQGEHLPADLNDAKWQLELESFCETVRLSSEWGIKDLKRSWLLFSEHRLPSDDVEMRRMIWYDILYLHNIRQRMMRVGQIGSVFQLQQFPS